MGLEGKRILFFAPAFFGYEYKIKEKMEQLGAVVDLYDERSVTKAYEKALLKISPQIFASKTNKYYSNILEAIKAKHYDYVLIVKCEMISIEILRKLKELFPAAKFCLYLYDSLNNIKGIEPKLKEFERVMSFDLNDVKKHSNMMFRPLFYLDCYQQEPKENNTYKYDVSFIGTIHSDRYAIIQKVKSMCDNKGLKYFFYCFLQSEFIFSYYKLTKPEFKKKKKKDFQFTKINSSSITEVVNQSRAILDIQHPKQTGLTMRTIEILGMNKKLITTNTHIKEYDFYNQENILVIDRNDVTIPEGFLTSPYQKVAKDVYIKYSIEQWIKDVLDC